MTIEILFPDIANLYGESGDIKLLQAIFKDQCQSTLFFDQPYFLKEDPQLIFMGPMSEQNQIRVIEKLSPHRERIGELIEKGSYFLFLGNALEIMIDRITMDGKEIKGLGFFPLESRVDFKSRQHSLVHGRFQDLDILGFRSQFSFIDPQENQYPFLHVIRDTGQSNSNAWEGIHYKNFFASYLIGPFLILNPLFLRGLLDKMGHEKLSIPAYDQLLAAYEKRLEEFKDPRTRD